MLGTARLRKCKLRSATFQRREQNPLTLAGVDRVPSPTPSGFNLGVVLSLQHARATTCKTRSACAAAADTAYLDTAKLAKVIRIARRGVETVATFCRQRLTLDGVCPLILWGAWEGSTLDYVTIVTHFLAIFVFEGTSFEAVDSLGSAWKWWALNLIARLTSSRWRYSIVGRKVEHFFGVLCQFLHILLRAIE